MALGDKLPPADHFTQEAANQAADLAAELATKAHATAWVEGREDHEGEADEYELDGEPPTPAQLAVPVYLALARARADMPKVTKKELYNAAGTRYNFRGVDRVVNATRPVLARHGLVVFPELLHVDRRDVARKGGEGRSVETVVQVRFHVVGPQGDELPPLVVLGEALDTSDKGAAKAMSVAWRVALIQLLHIATGDPDPDSMMIERGDIDRGQPVFDPEEYRRRALNAQTTHAELNQMINDLKALGQGHQMVANEFGEQERLGSMIYRIRNERRGGAPDGG